MRHEASACEIRGYLAAFSQPSPVLLLYASLSVRHWATPPATKGSWGVGSYPRHTLCPLVGGSRHCHDHMPNDTTNTGSTTRRHSPMPPRCRPAYRYAGQWAWVTPAIRVRHTLPVGRLKCVRLFRGGARHGSRPSHHQSILDSTSPPTSPHHHTRIPTPSIIECLSHHDVITSSPLKHMSYAADIYIATACRCRRRE